MKSAIRKCTDFVGDWLFIFLAVLGITAMAIIGSAVILTLAIILAPIILWVRTVSAVSRIIRP